MATPTRCPRCGATTLPPHEFTGRTAADWVCPNCGATEAMQFDEVEAGATPDDPDA